jgi:hypothetical protein
MGVEASWRCNEGRAYRVKQKWERTATGDGRLRYNANYPQAGTGLGWILPLENSGSHHRDDGTRHSRRTGKVPLRRA